MKIAVIGGSGLYDINNPSEAEELNIVTPWGETSDSILKTEEEGHDIYFLSRHGRGHLIAPSEINFRANIYALKFLGVDWIISVSAVGSLKENIPPGMIILPDQFLDFTKNRESTFFSEGIVAHVSMAKPVSEVLSNALKDACDVLDIPCGFGGTYVCIEGPQFSSLAESNFFRSLDAVIGIRCCNILTSTIAVDVKIAKSGADYFLAKGVVIPPNSAIELIQGGAKIVLDSTNTLEAVSDTASSLDVTVSYIDTISS